MPCRLYLDASALVKLVVEEPQSDALGALIAEASLISSAVAGVEVRLAAARSGITRAVEAADEVMRTVARVWMTSEVIRVAGRLTRLRALDAIHVASALSLGASIDGFVAYDRRLREIAAGEGLRVLAPT
jgi:predicted nucleic acid-binding protein